MPENRKRIGRKGKLLIASCVAVALATAIVVVIISHREHEAVTLVGAVVRQDADPAKRTPIADAQITATEGRTVVKARSDSLGAFELTLPSPNRLAQKRPITLSIEHPEYRQLELTVKSPDRILVAAMTPTRSEAPPALTTSVVKIANVSVRYSVQSTTRVEVGTAVKAFEVVNTGNVPCDGQGPCSPDGRWKAATATASLDAGEQNEFRNARVSCIAGPCPFTKIDSDQFSQGGQSISVTVLNWSDTTTFLLEAEVVRSTTGDIGRVSYPFILGQRLNFSLPANGNGPSIEAELDGIKIVFPLGPGLCLSWASCKLTTDEEKNQDYRCELKPGYTF